MRERWLGRVQRDSRARVVSDRQHGAGVPIVPFVPVRCPRCREGQPVTYGARELRAGKTRYHICQGCGLKFQSLEVDPTSDQPVG